MIVLSTCHGLQGQPLSLHPVGLMDHITPSLYPLCHHTSPEKQQSLPESLGWIAVEKRELELDESKIKCWCGHVNWF